MEKKDIVVVKKELGYGLQKGSIDLILSQIKEDKKGMILLDIVSPLGASSLMGFITVSAYESIEYDDETLTGFLQRALRNGDEGERTFTWGTESLKVMIFGVEVGNEADGI